MFFGFMFLFWFLNFHFLMDLMMNWLFSIFVRRLWLDIFMLMRRVKILEVEIIDIDMLFFLNLGMLFFCLFKTLFKRSFH